MIGDCMSVIAVLVCAGGGVQVVVCRWCAGVRSVSRDGRQGGVQVMCRCAICQALSAVTCAKVRSYRTNDEVRTTPGQSDPFRSE